MCLRPHSLSSHSAKHFKKLRYLQCFPGGQDTVIGALLSLTESHYSKLYRDCVKGLDSFFGSHSSDIGIHAISRKKNRPAVLLRLADRTWQEALASTRLSYNSREIHLCDKSSKTPQGIRFAAGWASPYRLKVLPQLA